MQKPGRLCTLQKSNCYLPIVKMSLWSIKNMKVVFGCVFAFRVMSMSISALYLIGWIARDVGVIAGLWPPNLRRQDWSVQRDWSEPMRIARGLLFSRRYCNLRARLLTRNQRWPGVGSGVMVWMLVTRLGAGVSVRDLLGLSTAGGGGDMSIPGLFKFLRAC